MRALALILALSTALCPLVAPEDAKVVHSRALSLANDDKIAESLPHFRAAVRADPVNFEYLNNLWVTEMRLGELKKAATRFLESVYLSGERYQVAVDNLEDLKEFMSREDWEEAERDWWINRSSDPGTSLQRHKTRPLPIVDYDTTFDPANETAQMFLSGDHPYMLRGAMTSWPLDNFSLQSLVSKFTNTRVDYYPQNMKQENVRPFFSTLSDAIANFDSPSGIYEKVDASARNTYIQWNVNQIDWEQLKDIGMSLPPQFRTDDQWIPSCFQAQDTIDSFHIKTHWRMVLIGQAGAGMFNHKDTLRSSSFQAQVAGRKRWHLCSDSQTPNLYRAGDVDCFGPNYDLYPKALDLDCYDVVVNTGDMLYYPQSYWHQTRNLDPVTVSVSGTLVTSGNRKGISDEFKRECDPSTGVRIFPPEERLCKGLERCYHEWEFKNWGEDLAQDLIDISEKTHRDEL